MRAASAGLILALAALVTWPADAIDQKKVKAKAPPHAAAGAPPEELGNAESWSAYTYKQKGGRVCYLIGQPQKTAPADAKRRQPVAMVTHRPEEKSFNVVSFNEGYPLKDGSDVTVDIGGSKYTLFTRGESAWAATSELDKTIVEALAKGKRAVVVGTSQRGTTTTDTYPLSGFAKALALIDGACGVKR